MIPNVRKCDSPDAAPRESRPSADVLGWLRESEPLPPCIRFSGSQSPELGCPHWPAGPTYSRKLHPHPA